MYIYICACVCVCPYDIFISHAGFGGYHPNPKKRGHRGCLPQDHLHHLARFLRFADLLGRDDTTEVPFGWCYDLVGGFTPSEKYEFPNIWKIKNV